MGDLINQLMDPRLAILLCSLVLMIIVLISLLIIRTRRDVLLKAEMQRLTQTVRDENERLRLESNSQAQRSREEFTTGVRGMSDSLVRVMGEISRTQQGQMDSFGTQLRTNSREEESRMIRMQEVVETRLGAYESRMDKISSILDDRLLRLQEDNARKLDQMRMTVDEKLDETLNRRLRDSFKLVTEQLEQVYKGLGEMQSLASGVGDLKRVLTNVKTRGVWGEIQLGNLLEQILTNGQYEANVCVKPGSNERVEYAVKLPGKDLHDEEIIYLPIDAKFPQESYQRLLEAADASDPIAVEAAAKELEAVVLREGKRIREKYISPPHTTDFAVMFLPVEGLYAEVLRRTGLSEKMQTDHRVMVAGPTTLSALLNSLQMGFRTLAIEKRTSDIWSLLGAVKTEFGTFADMLVKTQKKLKQASDSIDDAARKTRTIQRKLRSVQELSQEESKKLIGNPYRESPEEEEDDDE